MMGRARYLRVRRAFDVVGSGVGLVLAAPLLGAAAVGILATMGKPVFFKQERVGHRGEFEILKFRTMVDDAWKIGDGLMTSEMIPPFGRFLRRWSLDELPQLVNIVRGDMSLIGPRAALPRQVDRYNSRQKQRLSVPQGLTGLAQVKYRNEAPWSTRIEADLEYVENLGPAIDLKILARTLQSVISGKGMRMDQTSIAEIEDFGSNVADASGEEQGY